MNIFLLNSQMCPNSLSSRITLKVRVILLKIIYYFGNTNLPSMVKQVASVRQGVVTPAVGDDDNAWFVNFDNGNVNQDHVDNRNRVLLVRS